MLRVEIGAALRRIRMSKRLTLRQVSALANVSLGYLSELERGQKEASSELLNSICNALAIDLHVLLYDVAHALESTKSVTTLTTLHRATAHTDIAA